jgi:transglutaminase-like putative cysteine protease
MDAFLTAGRFIESDAREIVAFAREAAAGPADPVTTAIRVFKAVRDQVSYDPYGDFSSPDTFSARVTLQRRRGFCIPKAALLAACARVVGIPARLGFADVRNHLASPRLVKANNGDVFRWHSYAELFLEGKWVKATPAFDQALCERCGIKPLEFDGQNDSVFHPYDQNNQRHMEYVEDRGIYADVPMEKVLATWREHSPGLFDPTFFAGARAFAAEVEVAAE